MYEGERNHVVMHDRAAWRHGGAAERALPSVRSLGRNDGGWDAVLEIAELDERDWRGAVAAGDPRFLIERFIEEIGFAPTQDAAAAGAEDGRPGSSPAR